MKKLKIEDITTLEEVYRIAKPTTAEKQLLSYKGKSRRLLGAQAMLQAEMIAEVYNERIKLDWDNYNQKKWFGWWDYSKNGSGFSVSPYYYWLTRSAGSSRLHFASEKLFWKAVKTFPKVYKTLMKKQ